MNPDIALNLTQLAKATGYSRAALSAMKLPLQAGKMSLRDFRWLMRCRIEFAETPATLAPVSERPPPTILDKSRVLHKTCGPQAASHLLDRYRAHSSE
jgi:hypothetical protein